MFATSSTVANAEQRGRPCSFTKADHLICALAAALGHGLQGDFHAVGARRTGHILLTVTPVPAVHHYPLMEDEKQLRSLRAWVSRKLVFIMILISPVACLTT